MNRDEALIRLSELEMTALGAAMQRSEAPSCEWRISRQELSGLLDKWHLRTMDVLSRQHFIDVLRRERTRSDRSKAPLSIALCELEGDDLATMQELIDHLRANKRDTDQIGYLDDYRIALLLPDTDAAGAGGFGRKLQSSAPAFGFRVITQSYPDEIFDRLLGQHPAADVMHAMLLPAGSIARKPGYRLKRPLDVLASILLIALFAPLMLLTALAILLTSRGPIVFKQIRLGAGGVPFVFYKFRSMVSGADDSIHRRYVASLIEGDQDRSNQGDRHQPLYKLQRDPRITGVGRIIRRTSIDELPQLFNVLKGEMSLIGPRPPIPYEVERYQSWHLRRVLEIKPGITGLWQVEGRSRTSFDEMVRLDLQYVRECSLALDLKILFKTAAVVIKCDGAN